MIKVNIDLNFLSDDIIKLLISLDIITFKDVSDYYGNTQWDNKP